MSICDENIVKLEHSEEVVSEGIRRDYGLTNINNIGSSIVVCVEEVNGPTYTSNLTKMATGMTESSNGVFNITDSSMSFDHTFTGNVMTLTAYTGNFNYEVYARETIDQPGLDTFNSDIIFSNSTPFSGITASGFTMSDTLLSIYGDQEYILNSNYSFMPNECGVNEIVDTGLLNVYDDEHTLYFVALIDPETPILGPFPIDPPKTPRTLTVNRELDSDSKETYVFGVPQEEETSVNCQLITESLTINNVQADTFTLEYKPFDSTLMISVNGVTLSKADYTITDFVVVTLSMVLTPDVDSVTATYLACDTDLDSVTSEYYLITGVTSGTTAAVTGTDKVYYNTDESKYEYYVDTEISFVENTLLFINGIKLTYGLDYYQSITVDNRLIFNDTVLSISDIIHIIYNVGDIVEGDYGVINSSNDVLVWKVIEPIIVSDRVDGEFSVEVTVSSDPDFTSTATTIESIVKYINGETDYSVGISDSLTSNKNYIWRVTSSKVYNGLLDNTFTTSSVSKIGKFFTNNTINSY